MRDTRFPLLMQVSILIACITFILVFPISVVVELYSSFGIFQNRALFFDFRDWLLIVTAAFCALNLLINQSHWLRLISANFYLLLFVYISVVVLLHFDEIGFASGVNKSAAAYYFPIFFNCLLYCVLGTHVLYLTRFRYIFLLATVVAGCVILYFVDLSVLRIDVSGYTEDANRSNYQFIGDAMALSALLVVGMFSNSVFRVIFIVSSAAVLFLVGSRTSFAVYLFTTLLFLVLTTRLWWLAGSTIILFVLGVFYSNTIDWAELERTNPRMVRIFTEYEDDSSIIGRKDRDQIGWEDIANHPINGRFGGQRDIEEYWTAYMHNMWSYWRQFGFTPFAMLLVLYLLFAVLCLLRYRQRSNEHYKIPLLLGFFLVSESVLSRSFAFSYLHLFFGMLVAFHAWHKYGDKFYATNPQNRARQRRRRKKVLRSGSASQVAQQ